VGLQQIFQENKPSPPGGGQQPQLGGGAAG